MCWVDCSATYLYYQCDLSTWCNMRRYELLHIREEAVSRRPKAALTGSRGTELLYDMPYTRDASFGTAVAPPPPSRPRLRRGSESTDQYCLDVHIAYSDTDIQALRAMQGPGQSKPPPQIQTGNKGRPLYQLRIRKTRCYIAYHKSPCQTIRDNPSAPVQGSRCRYFPS